jgi:hypothetical protein
MPLQILYTDTDEVRSVLGVSEEDMSDAAIANRRLDLELFVDLHEWIPNHATLIADTSTADAQYISNNLSLYCSHFCAWALARSPLAIPQKITDGANGIERFGSIDFSKLANTLKENADKYKSNILLALDSTATTKVVQFSISTPDFDPITG